MQEIWFAGLDPQQREEFKKTLLGSQTLRLRLLKILSMKYETVERRGFKEEEYDNDSWVFKQAFNNGRLAAIREIADLFDFKQEKE